MHSWAITLKSDQLDTCGSLRHQEHVVSLWANDVFWIYGPTINQCIPNMVKQIPHQEIFRVDDSKKLFFLHSEVSCGTLPQGNWQPLDQLIGISTQLSYPCTNINEQKANIQFIPSEDMQSADYIRCTKTNFLNWIDTAPLIRFKSLLFCLINDDVLIRGSPLPSLPGEYYYQQHGIIVPCGHTWTPAIDAQILRQWLGVHAEDNAIHLSSQSDVMHWYYLAKNIWTPVSRANVRFSLLSQQELSGA